MAHGAVPHQFLEALNTHAPRHPKRLRCLAHCLSAAGVKSASSHRPGKCRRGYAVPVLHARLRPFDQALHGRGCSDDYRKGHGGGSAVA